MAIHIYPKASSLFTILVIQSKSFLSYSTNLPKLRFDLLFTNLNLKREINSNLRWIGSRRLEQLIFVGASLVKNNNITINIIFLISIISFSSLLPIWNHTSTFSWSSKSLIKSLIFVFIRWLMMIYSNVNVYERGFMIFQYTGSINYQFTTTNPYIAEIRYFQVRCVVI